MCSFWDTLSVTRVWLYVLDQRVKIEDMAAFFKSRAFADPPPLEFGVVLLRGTSVGYVGNWKYEELRFNCKVWRSKRVLQAARAGGDRLQ